MIYAVYFPPDQSPLSGEPSGMCDVSTGFPALSQGFTQWDFLRKSRPSAPPIGRKTARRARTLTWLAEASARVKVGADFVVRRQVELALWRQGARKKQKKTSFNSWNDC